MVSQKKNEMVYSMCVDFSYQIGSHLITQPPRTHWFEAKTKQASRTSSGWMRKYFTSSVVLRWRVKVRGWCEMGQASRTTHRWMQNSREEFGFKLVLRWMVKWGVNWCELVGIWNQPRQIYVTDLVRNRSWAISSQPQFTPIPSTIQTE